ncbi:hypothetical protein ACUXZZ_45370 (plasmid) [Streptomyces graminifolii]|uniref:hypothetical protein n=1 Tax=Streptomyces graminifolii TaxID=1266771 RepID=UPI004059F1BC
MSTAYDPDELVASLKQYAREGSETGALNLLIESDYWLRRIAYHHPQFVMVDAGVPFRLDWIEMGKAVARRELYASSSQQAILDVAVAIQVYGAPINLAEVLLSLDRTNTAAVLRAIATAAGHPDAAPQA